jgi:hypothetical protein
MPRDATNAHKICVIVQRTLLPAQHEAGICRINPKSGNRAGFGFLQCGLF